MNVLRIATAGSVDDGKSTLIGRLLVDSKAVLEDQMDAVRLASSRRGDASIDLALLTDGLRAEREQGITIDVAYRYFATARRKFIIADCPGHFQYTRNMVTGASTADVALILVDATKMLQEQTLRHCFVASLLRVPQVVVCVNKMDLVNFDQAAFEATSAQIRDLCQRLELQKVMMIPVSALTGDNVAAPTSKMPWYDGRCLLETLETLEASDGARDAALRLPVQCAILPRANSGMRDYRGYTGFIASGAVGAGDEVVLLPLGLRTRVSSIELGGAALSQARTPLSVTVRLRDELDIARGDMLTCPTKPPRVEREIEAMVCWMAPRPLSAGSTYLLRHTTAESKALVVSVDRTLDLMPQARSSIAAAAIGLNEFARIRLKVSRPLCYDPYRENRATGSFILIDESTFATVAAGMIL